MGVEEMIIQQAEERGVAKGIEKGVEQGIDIGATQVKTKAAKNMIRKGFDTPFICGILEVTPEFVEMIRREMNGGT